MSLISKLLIITSHSAARESNFLFPPGSCLSHGYFMQQFGDLSKPLLFIRFRNILIQRYFIMIPEINTGQKGAPSGLLHEANLVVLFYESAPFALSLRCFYSISLFLALLSPQKKRRISPLSPPALFRRLLCQPYLVEAFDSAENIFPHQGRSVMEIIHRLCHDLRTFPCQHGQPEDVVGKFPQQGKVVL